jgi:hypothetical protein
MREMSSNLRAMIERKKLIRKGTDESEERAEEILRAVERNGGLTDSEIYELMAY